MCNNTVRIGVNEIGKFKTNPDNTLILEYEDFEVWKTKHGEYYYIGFSFCDDDPDEFIKVEPIATLNYNIITEKYFVKGTELVNLFDCFCCGECVTDNDIVYYWFNAVGRWNNKGGK